MRLLFETKEWKIKNNACQGADNNKIFIALKDAH